MDQINISEIVKETGVKFGTSGIRALSTDLTDKVCYLYTTAFISFIKSKYSLEVQKVALAGDFRPSTPRMKAAVGKALIDAGFEVVDCGTIPTPAVTFYGIQNRIPSIMITGSHIPDDRNGIKFNKPDGEILKSDETGMLNQTIKFDPNLFDSKGNLKITPTAGRVDNTALEMYKARYLSFFEKDILKNKKIGVYGHSSVGRDVIFEVLQKLGAEVTKLGYSEKFIPVDTEAIREEDKRLALEWSKEYNLDSIVSADGDADRPLVSDENGIWLRGDIDGILVAKYLGADFISTTVNCNTAVEKSDLFKKVERTKIGSPHVITTMMQATRGSYNKVVGYEGNGGFLTDSIIMINDRQLKPLPTRDALIVILSILALGVKENKKISELSKDLPQRFTASDRIKDFPTEDSIKLIEQLKKSPKNIGEIYEQPVIETNELDGLRMYFENEDIIHLRPSGNAPELRVYIESNSPESAEKLNQDTIKKIKEMRI